MVLYNCTEISKNQVFEAQLNPMSTRNGVIQGRSCSSVEQYVSNASRFAVIFQFHQTWVRSIFGQCVAGILEETNI